MAYQPSVRQAEWAVDQAVGGTLTKQHVANYRKLGLAAYSPQGLFPKPALAGGGSVPPQILLGILANESNLWQASGHVARGGFGNPLTGDVYGRGSTSNINPGQVDCGFGIAQVTDGMRKGQLDSLRQRAIAQDFEANIAAGLQILAKKWNQLRSYTPAITATSADPQWIESWYFALWAYNSGVQPDVNNGNATGCTPGPSCTDSGGRWGLGWFNNPSNPIYPSGRHLFNSVPTDPATPAKWPYQERVIGWAANPFYDSAGSYLQAWWPSAEDRDRSVPPPNVLCTTANLCSMSAGTGTCSRTDLHCWTNFPVVWKQSDCGFCGHSQSRYSSTAALPADPVSADPATCGLDGLPSTAVIVDDMAAGASRYSPCTTGRSSGSFAFDFTADANGNYPAHIDLHQINGGYNGHYWFTHVAPQTSVTEVRGTWTFPSAVNGWGDVYVHVPALGANSLQAKYTVRDAATGAQRYRVVDTYLGKNAWIPLGAMKLSPGSTVQQTSVVTHEQGVHNLAFDAAAFVPRSKPAQFVVALGDSFSSGEGVPPFDTRASGNPSNDCHRSTAAYARTMRLPGQTVPATDSRNDLHFLACSGAIAESLTAKAAVGSIPSVPAGPDYQNGQELQLDRGFLSPDTTIVTLTIGGNNARFSDVATHCFAFNCPTSTMSGDPSPLETYEPYVISTLIPPKLAAVYDQIHQAAPNAKIYVSAYPRLFDGTYLLVCAALSPEEQRWIRDLTQQLSAATKQQIDAARARGLPIYFVDSQSEFVGHEICNSAGSPQYFNGIDAVNVSYSLHPNAPGQFAYARAFTTAMASP